MMETKQAREKTNLTSMTSLPLEVSTDSFHRSGMSALTIDNHEQKRRLRSIIFYFTIGTHIFTTASYFSTTSPTSRSKLPDSLKLFCTTSPSRSSGGHIPDFTHEQRDTSCFPLRQHFLICMAFRSYPLGPDHVLRLRLRQGTPWLLLQTTAAAATATATSSSRPAPACVATMTAASWATAQSHPKITTREPWMEHPLPTPLGISTATTTTTFTILTMLLTANNTHHTPQLLAPHGDEAKFRCNYS